MRMRGSAIGHRPINACAVRLPGRQRDRARTAGAQEATWQAELTVLVAFGAWYVLGARSGPDRHDQIVDKARELWRDPRVQGKAEGAQWAQQW